MDQRRAMWGAGIGLLVAVAVIGGIFLGRVSDTLAHSMTFDTGVPTRFSPQPVFFCNALHQSGGLRRMVDNAGIGSTESSSAENTNLLTLMFVVAASPDQTTRKAMVGLYQDVLRGDSQSSAAQRAIGTVEVMNSCARYP
jgi:hypothetical protein